MSDGWKSDEKALAGKLHVVSKRYTQRIERHNLYCLPSPSCEESTLAVIGPTPGIVISRCPVSS
ncbi:transposase [Xenorhabdus kozodoii]|uniref:Transposase n=1 Tax=Xenorhabdus kozodoii TaxID=351676 RepID=A0A2D0LC40_9GAMM|nr:transposase [Xenorhabdus kozodoii]